MFLCLLIMRVRFVVNLFVGAVVDMAMIANSPIPVMRWNGIRTTQSQFAWSFCAKMAERMHASIRAANTFIHHARCWIRWYQKDSRIVAAMTGVHRCHDMTSIVPLADWYAGFEHQWLSYAIGMDDQLLWLLNLSKK